MMFSDVKALIWDFDGTLYKQQPGLWDAIRESEIRVIRHHTGWTEQKAREAFYSVYKVRTPSGTQTVSILTGIPNRQAAKECAIGVEYGTYLHKDAKLADMFGKLTGYRHFMLVNGIQQSVLRGLELLGLDRKLFEEIVTSELVGESKPGEAGYRRIREMTGLPFAAHMMIGDREPVDLATAKRLGMKTCLVWSDTPGTIADVTLPTVYAVADMLG